MNIKKSAKRKISGIHILSVLMNFSTYYMPLGYLCPLRSSTITNTTIIRPSSNNKDAYNCDIDTSKYP
jgi:hypothetical protein